MKKKVGREGGKC
jgi:hypothetical protein